MLDTELFCNVTEERPPKDAVLLARAGSYEVYALGKGGPIGIYTTEYHPGSLLITKDGLDKLLADLK